MNRKQQVGYGLNTLIQILLMLGIVVAVNAVPRTMKAINLFGARIPLQKEWDLTKDKAHSISDQSQKALIGLEKPVTAVLFVQKGSPDEQELRGLLDRYAFYSNKFSYRIEDPERNPVVARDYGVKQLRTLVLESGGQRQNLVLPFGDNTAVESKLTSALLQIINPTRAVVYFTKGHGELEPDESKPNGLSSLKADLEGEGYEIKPLTLFGQKDVPADATVVVVAGTTKDFFPEETAALERYIQKGGRVLWLANLVLDEKAAIKLENVDRFLSKHGVDPTHLLVVSKVSYPSPRPDRFLIPAGVKYDAHPITEGFRVATFFLAPQALKIGKIPEGGVVQPLVWTVDDSYEYANPLKAANAVIRAQQPGAAYDPKVDQKGAALLAVAGTFKKPEKPAASPAPSPAASPAADPDKPAPEGRLVVVANEGFVSNQLVRLGANEDLMLNSLAWLAERTAQISIDRPKEKQGPVTLDETTKDRLLRIGFPLVPCIVGLIGVLVHIVFKRR